MKRLVSNAVQTVSDAAIPGLILVRKTQLIEILAIVYDFGRNAPYRLHWIRQVIEAIIETTQRRRLRRVSFPLFEVAHSSLLPGEVLDVLIRALTLGTVVPLQSAVLRVGGNMLA